MCGHLVLLHEAWQPMSSQEVASSIDVCLKLGKRHRHGGGQDAQMGSGSDREKWTAAVKWVQLVLRSKYLPDLYLDLMVKRLDGDRWVTIDVRVKGITYVGVKKNGFRELIEKESVTALIASLDSKNVQYFSNLCIKSDVSGEPPCWVIQMQG